MEVTPLCLVIDLKKFLGKSAFWPHLKNFLKNRFVGRKQIDLLAPPKTLPVSHQKIGLLASKTFMFINHLPIFTSSQAIGRGRPVSDNPLIYNIIIFFQKAEYTSKTRVFCPKSAVLNMIFINNLPTKHA
jgi:hypothetical protein